MSTEPEPAGEELLGAARALRRRFSAALREHDIAPGQARALRTIAEDPGLRLSALAQALRIAPRSATQVMDALAERGLAARAPDPSDRRATRLLLTDAGARMLETIDRVRAVESDRFLAPLTAEDQAHLSRILRLLTEAPDA